MTDLEFDIVDELYFVTSYTELQKKMALESSILFNSVNGLIKIGYINYYIEPDGVQNPELNLSMSNIQNLYFLASKKGLFAHNSK